MLEFFTNPAFLAAAGALVSAPIIIHLINRMRFKRIRWAAMEFLLKAQKRNRRRLIIEQLILLALRCLLVALAGILVMRFVGFSFADVGAKPALHVVLLDDTLSMNDQWKEAETPKTAFSVALNEVFVEKIVRGLSQSNSTDQLILLPLSQVLLDPNGQPKVYTKLNDKSTVNDLGQDIYKLYGDKYSKDDNEQKAERDWNNLAALMAAGFSRSGQGQLHATALHVPILAGVKKAQEVINANPESRATLHVLSDFRQNEWTLPDGENLHKLLVQLSKEHPDLKIRMIDAVNPYRTTGQGGIPLAHENVGIVDFRAGTRVVGKGMPVTFTVTLANYSAREVEVNVVIEDDTGTERKEIDMNPAMPIRIPAGSVDTKVTFDFRDYPQIKAGETHFARLTARLESGQRGKLENDGLAQDNARHAAVEIRDKVPVLLVDGEGSRGRVDNQDSFFIRTAIISVPGASYEIENGDELGGGLPTKVLESANLAKYPTIFFANVREFNPKQLANLENYVRDGGGVCFFMGPLVNPAYYNKYLYNGGKGLFPAPLKDSYFPPSNEEPLKPQFTGDYQLLLREDLFGRLDAIPIFGSVFKDESQKSRLKDLPIKRYYQVPRSGWRPEQGKVFELATLPNDARATAFTAAALDLVRGPALRKIMENDELKKYQKGLERHRRIIESIVSPTSDKNAFALAAALEAMLQDKGKEKDAGEYPNLTEFWAYPDPKVSSLRKDVVDLRDQAKFGDPFIVAGNYGKGKVVAIMTTAGKEWNEWGGGSDAAVIYQPFIWEMQNYLSSLSSDSSLTVGAPLQVTVDPELYKQKGRGQLKMVRTLRIPQQGKPAREVRDREQFGQENKGLVTFSFDKSLVPGFYSATLRFADAADKGIPLATYGQVFNVDTLKEGSLARTAYDEIDHNIIRLAQPGAVVFEGPGIPADTLVSRRTDLSESPWLFLFFIAILVAEQALAVHLSFHLKGDETTALTQAKAKLGQTQAA
jgi:hypothetical protein